MGKTNIDTDTGIRYGVISQRSVNSDALDDFYFGSSSTDMARENFNEQLEADLRRALEPYLSSNSIDEAVEAVMDLHCIGDEYEGEMDPLYEDDGYSIQKCLDSDLLVGKSPYFTYAQYCSPCVPGACNLDSPLDPNDCDHVRCYCLGHDWFDGGKAPYTVYDVATGEKVSPMSMTVTQYP